MDFFEKLQVINAVQDSAAKSAFLSSDFVSTGAELRATALEDALTLDAQLDARLKKKILTLKQGVKLDSLGAITEAKTYKSYVMNAPETQGPETPVYTLYGQLRIYYAKCIFSAIEFWLIAVVFERRLKLKPEQIAALKAAQDRLSVLYGFKRYYSNY